MSKLKVEGGTKSATLKITIIGHIEIDDLEDMSMVEEALENIRMYGDAEITHTEVVVKEKLKN